MAGATKEKERGNGRQKQKESSKKKKTWLKVPTEDKHQVSG